MSTTRQHPHSKWFYLKIAIILMAHQISPNFAYGDIFVMNASMIESDCVASCNTTKADYVFNVDCQRGCRFFEKFRTASILAQFDDMAALETCHQSCLEAYGNETRKRMACSNGCSSAQHAYRKVYSLSLQWLQEVHKNGTFFATLIDMTDAVVNSRRFVDVRPIRLKSTNKNRKVLPVNEELFPTQTQQTEETQADLPDENYDTKKPSSMVPDWIAQSAFVFFILGIVLLLGVCCYCCIFAHFFRHMRENNIDTALPPSYEELIRNSYVIMSASRINLYHPVRINKREESCSIDINATAEDTVAEAPLI